MTRHCPIHGEYEDETFRVGPRVVTVTTCPECDIEDQHEAPESIEDMNRRMNIEREFWGATFDNFDTPTVELMKSRDAIKRVCNGITKKAVMIGTNGTGKTHLGCAALHFVGSGRIMTAYEIGTAIRATYVPGCKRTELDVIEPLALMPLLVIDEIGRSKGGDADERWFSYIVDKRHTRGLPIILISNKHDRKTCTRGGCVDCIENYLTEDSMSRLSQGGVILRFSGQDFRRK
jgi:DNA replication protein DnaC